MLTLDVRSLRDPPIHDSAMHNLCRNFVFLCMRWTDWRTCKHPKSYRKAKKFHQITRIRFNSFHLKQTVDQIKRNFFPPIHNSFCSQNHLGFSEIWFMQSTVKLDIKPREIFTNINCAFLTSYICDTTHNFHSLVHALSTQILSCEFE